MRVKIYDLKFSSAGNCIYRSSTQRLENFLKQSQKVMVSFLILLN